MEKELVFSPPKYTATSHWEPYFVDVSLDHETTCFHISYLYIGWAGCPVTAVEWQYSKVHQFFPTNAKIIKLNIYLYGRVFVLEFSSNQACSGVNWVYA